MAKITYRLRPLYPFKKPFKKSAFEHCHNPHRGTVIDPYLWSSNDKMEFIKIYELLLLAALG
jgi:hypothetical protein